MVQELTTLDIRSEMPRWFEIGCRTHACPILCNRMKYSMKSRRKETSYIQINEVELTGLVTYCVLKRFIGEEIQKTRR